jgi:uncharacterized membrane protein YfcA
VTLPSLLATLALAALIGFSLGLLGGGGSILAVPVLVYAAGLEPAAAVATSLAVVGTTSLIAALQHARAGRVDWGAALGFGVTGALGALAGSRLTALVPPRTLLLLFALLMLVVGSLMRRPGPGLAPGRRHPAAVPVAGLVVGALTGFLGVGGGFLIVPALVLLARLEMPAAVGTSLVVIAVNAAAGLVGHAGRELPPPGLTAGFTAVAVAGALAGSRLVGRVPPERLRRGFAALVILIGLALVARNLG